MSKKSDRLKILLTSFISLSFGVYLLISNFNENIIFFYSPTELKEAKNLKKIIRVGGLVHSGSIKHLHDHYEFILTDYDNEVKVRYSGILPALFKENQGMVAKGSLNTENILIANELLTKHDENYMPKEVIDSLKKSGKFKPNSKLDPTRMENPGRRTSAEERKCTMSTCAPEVTMFDEPGASFVKGIE